MKFVAIFTALALISSAQQQSQVPDTGFKISVTTNLVIVDVDVRDKSGKPIEGLSAKDFTVYEDDKAQKVTVFEYQRLETDALPAEPEPPPSVKNPVAKADAPKLAEAKRAITPSAPGQIRYKDRRLLVMFFDFSSMAQEDQFRAQTSALKFLDTQITAADMVSIMTFSNKLQVVEDFTNDRQKLLATIKGFHIGEGSDLAIDAATGDNTEGEDNGAAFTADETEFSVFNTDRKLSALESAAKML